jgi:DNA-binding Xre family transcriptional regulator
MVKFNPNKIVGIIAERKITKESLAQMIGISSMSLRDKLKEQKPMKVSELCAVANILNEPIQNFFVSSASEIAK